jgi:hypothetical protein
MAAKSGGEAGFKAFRLPPFGLEAMNSSLGRVGTRRSSSSDSLKLGGEATALGGEGLLLSRFVGGDLDRRVAVAINVSVFPRTRRGSGTVGPWGLGLVRFFGESKSSFASPIFLPLR